MGNSHCLGAIEQLCEQQLSHGGKGWEVPGGTYGHSHSFGLPPWRGLLCTGCCKDREKGHCMSSLARLCGTNSPLVLSPLWLGARQVTLAALHRSPADAGVCSGSRQPGIIPEAAEAPSLQHQAEQPPPGRSVLAFVLPAASVGREEQLKVQTLL